LTPRGATEYFGCWEKRRSSKMSLSRQRLCRSDHHRRGVAGVYHAHSRFHQSARLSLEGDDREGSKQIPNRIFAGDVPSHLSGDRY